MARTWNAEHGTLSCYKRGCRRPECTAANRRYDEKRRRNIAYGLPTTSLIDAGPVRQHVLELQAAGLSIDQQSRLAGVPRPAIQRLLYGLKKQGRAPLKTIDARNALPLMALTATIDTLPPIARVAADGTRRRTLSMAAIGHTVQWQAAEVSYTRRHYWEATLRSSRVTVDLARRVRDLYDRTWNQPAEDSPVARRTIRWARERGGLLPMEIDDEFMDLTDVELAGECARRAEAMDYAELIRCEKARAQGDRSPLIVAGAARYLEVRRTRRKAAA